MASKSRIAAPSRRKLRLLSLDSHIGLGNAAKGLSKRAVNAFCECNEPTIRAAIEHLAGALEIFKCQMNRVMIWRIPPFEDPKNLSSEVYYGEKFISDEDAAELQRIEESLKRLGFAPVKPIDLEKFFNPDSDGEEYQRWPVQRKQRAGASPSRASMTAPWGTPNQS